MNFSKFINKVKKSKKQNVNIVFKEEEIVDGLAYGVSTIYKIVLQHSFFARCPLFFHRVAYLIAHGSSDEAHKHSKKYEEEVTQIHKECSQKINFLIKKLKKSNINIFVNGRAITSQEKEIAKLERHMKILTEKLSPTNS